MKFRDLERGPAAGRLEDFELPGGAVAKIRVIPLLAGRDREIEAGAAEYARANGAEPKAGEPTYERGVYAYTVLLATLDPADGAPFFASVAEMLDPVNGLDRDRLAWLFEIQQQAQSDFAPQRGKLTNEQFFDWLNRTAEAGDDADLPFERSPRSMQRAYARGTAQLYKTLAGDYLRLARTVESLQSEISSLRDKSGPGPSSPGTAKSFDPPASPSMPPHPPSPPPSAKGDP